jgi:hypothetical protein
MNIKIRLADFLKTLFIPVWPGAGDTEKSTPALGNLTKLTIIESSGFDFSLMSVHIYDIIKTVRIAGCKSHA